MLVFVIGVEDHEMGVRHAPVEDGADYSRDRAALPRPRIPKDGGVFAEELVDIDTHVVVSENRGFTDSDVARIILASLVEYNVEVFFASEPDRVVQFRIALHAIFELLAFVRLG